MVPDFTDDFLKELSRALELQPTDIITKTDFELIFTDELSFNKVKKVKQHPDHVAILKFLSEALAADYISAD